VSLDYSKMGQVVAAQMEALEADHNDPCTCEISDVVVIVHVVSASGEHEVRFRTSADTTPVTTLQLVLGVASTIATGPPE
jgi:hypothetical protein